ncbi:protein MHF2 homolog [Musa acuminata AAA Group]|uniref:protein MHF2 homolog n=1 Tax=Musa acuminata AAA Group TaxID=214697 RepID=UPI0031D3B207
MDATFDPDLIHAIFKMVWSRRAERNEEIDVVDVEVGAGTSKKSRPTTANPSALRVSCELLRLFVTEAIERTAIIAEAEGINKIEPTHLERILPQLLLDF